VNSSLARAAQDHKASPPVAQTLKRFRDFFPGLLDRKIRPQWLEAGVATLGQRLNARVKEILAGHQQAAGCGQEKAEILAKAAAR